jgi:hypothetical protein
VHLHDLLVVYSLPKHAYPSNLVPRTTLPTVSLWTSGVPILFSEPFVEDTHQGYMRTIQK